MEDNETKQDGNVLNRYEAVLVAAKLSRKINGLRIAAKEQLSAEELAAMDRRKVTSVALEELSSGKVQYERKVVIEEESTFDLT
jgi:DNA-directed RNA polymerase omega subunit